MITLRRTWSYQRRVKGRDNPPESSGGSNRGNCSVKADSSILQASESRYAVTGEGFSRCLRRLIPPRQIGSASACRSGSVPMFPRVIKLIGQCEIALNSRETETLTPPCPNQNSPIVSAGKRDRVWVSFKFRQLRRRAARKRGSHRSIFT